MNYSMWYDYINYKVMMNTRARFIFMESNKEKIKKHIQDNYQSIALLNAQGCGTSCCNGSQQEINLLDVSKISENLGYSLQDLTDLPDNANMGLGCGNPILIASLKEGETVLDLGSGGGFDCFLARKQVGSKGLVIGVDMTIEMIQLATKNAMQLGYDNVEFRLGEIENLPVKDGTVDVIISNCVINLSLEKEQVFHEAYRVLKNGGRLAISDVLATAELPEDIKDDLSMFSGCVSGAEYTENIHKLLEKVGFKNIKMKPKDNSREIIKSWVPSRSIEDYVASYIIEAQK